MLLPSVLLFLPKESNEKNDPTPGEGAPRRFTQTDRGKCLGRPPPPRLENLNYIFPYTR